MKYKIPFHKSIKNAAMEKALINAYNSQSLSGDGCYTDAVLKKISQEIGCEKILMTTSGSQALNMACRLAGFKKGDEVIMPSFAYTSCANSILLTGARPVFCDVDDNLNADVKSVERLINENTKGIMIIHYGGVPCDMKRFMELKKRYGLVLIEDAAHGFGSTFEGKALGTIGDFGIYSFHQTKNLTSGEGGAIVISDDKTYEDALIYHQKGSDRYAFVKGEVPFYQWYGLGESVSPSDLLMALLEVQLDFLMMDNEKRAEIIRQYNHVCELSNDENVIGHTMNCDGINNHLYFIQYKTAEQAQEFTKFMQGRGIDVRTHYVPLHKTAFGDRFTVDIKRDTTHLLGKTVVRLPLYYEMSDEDIQFVCEALKDGLKYCSSRL